MKTCQHERIEPYGDGDWARCESCGDGSFPVTGKAAGLGTEELGSHWAVKSYQRSLVEGCCAGAVVRRLPKPPPYHAMEADPLCPLIPITQAIEPLAGEVAQELLARCPPCGGTTCGICEDRDEYRPPFAAAYYDAGGVRTYVLASGECPACKGAGEIHEEHEPWATETLGCGYCEGTGTRTDVRAIADRYQPDRPWRDEDTPRLARFEVRT